MSRERKEDKVRARSLSRIQDRGIIRQEKIIIVAVYEVTRIIATLEGGVILVILIAVRGVDREKAISEVEVIRKIDSIIAEGEIRHTPIVEIEIIEEVVDIVEIVAEKGAAVTRVGDDTQ